MKNLALTGMAGVLLASPVGAGIRDAPDGVRYRLESQATSDPLMRQFALVITRQNTAFDMVGGRTGINAIALNPPSPGRADGFVITPLATESVLDRPRFYARSRLSAAEREEVLDIYLAACRWTRVYYAWRPNVRDEGDNHVIELAVAGSASAIVTRNIRDFRAGAGLRFPHIAIVSPAQLLKGKP